MTSASKRKLPPMEWAAQLAKNASDRLRNQGLMTLNIPVSCHVEVPEGCGFHVIQVATSGVDLDCVSVLQLLQEPCSCPGSSLFGLTIALHLDGKPNVRVVLAYTCKPEDLLVPLTRWVIRSPTGCIVVLAPPRSHPDSRPAEIMLYSGDLPELLDYGSIAAATETIAVSDERIARKAQFILERLWYWELRERQLDPRRERQGPGKLTQSIKLWHRVTALDRVVCDGFAVQKEFCEGEFPKGEIFAPPPNTWKQLEEQMVACVAKYSEGPKRIVSREEAASKKQSRVKNKPAKKIPETSQEELGASEREWSPRRGDEGRRALQRINTDSSLPESDTLAEADENSVCGKSDSPDREVGMPEDDVYNVEIGDNVSAATNTESSMSHPKSDEMRDRSDSNATVSKDEKEECPSRPPGIFLPRAASDHSSKANASAHEEAAWDRVSSCASSSGLESSRVSRTTSDPYLASASEAGASESLVHRVGADGHKKIIKFTRSWADLSENIEDEDDEEHGVEPDMVFEAQYMRDQVSKRLTEHQTKIGTSWTQVDSVLADLAAKVTDALSGAITEATGDLLVPEQRVDVPANHRSWSTLPGTVEACTSHGLLSESEPWISPVSELGQWYELRRPELGMISGVVLTGDKKGAWVEIVKLKIMEEEGVWSDVNNGGLFPACCNAKDPVEVCFQPVKAIAVRIYPVVWHGGNIALHAALIEPKRDAIILGETASEVFRQDARKALAGMMTAELQILNNLAQYPRQNSADISDLVNTLYSIPTKVADAATRFESSIVKAWKEKARADEYAWEQQELTQARQWVETIPEDQPLDMAARAQAAAWDKVSEALMVLEEVHSFTASSVAETMLRAKMHGKTEMTSSETRHMQHGLNKKAQSNSHRQRHVRGSGASTCTLETVVEDAFEAEEGQAKKVEFWLDLFLNGHAFRVGGPGDSLIWEPEEIPVRIRDGEPRQRYRGRTYSYRLDDEVHKSELGANALQSGNGEVGEIIRMNGIEAWRTVSVNVVLGGNRRSGFLAPLRFLSRDCMFRASTTAQAECGHVVMQLLGSKTDEALSVIDGKIQLSSGRQGWEHEASHRHWSVVWSDHGYRFKFGNLGELAADGPHLTLKKTGQQWKLIPCNNSDGCSNADGLAVYMMSGNGSISQLPGGLVEYTTDSTRRCAWHVFQQCHGSAEMSGGSAFRSYQLEPGKGVFHAAKAWKKTRDIQAANVSAK